MTSATDDTQGSEGPFEVYQRILRERLRFFLYPLQSTLRSDIMRALQETGKLLDIAQTDKNAPVPAGSWSLLTLLTALSIAPNINLVRVSSVAVSVECLICALDLLDDVEDGDQTAIIKESGPARVLNVSTALLVLAQRMVLSVSEREFPAADILRCFDTIQESLLVAITGQQRDLLAEQRAVEQVTVEECIEIASEKAGALMSLMRFGKVLWLPGVSVCFIGSGPAINYRGLKLSNLFLIHYASCWASYKHILQVFYGAMDERKYLMIRVIRWLRVKGKRLLTISIVVAIYASLLVANALRLSHMTLLLSLSYGFAAFIALAFLAVGAFVWLYARDRVLAFVLLCFSCTAMAPFAAETAAVSGDQFFSKLSTVCASLAVMLCAILLLLFPRNYLELSPSANKERLSEISGLRRRLLIVRCYALFIFTYGILASVFSALNPESQHLQTCRDEF